MKKFIFYTLLLSSFILDAQVQIGAEHIDTYEELYNEKTFIQIASSVPFSGEILKYKIYCINNKTKRLSDLSKIAYVELIDQNKKVIIHQKVKLENGVGFGDFRIPLSIATGSYKLITYTNWMRNLNASNYYQYNLSIINPLVKKSDHNITEATSFRSNIKNEENKLNQIVSQYIDINFNNNIYTPRQKVTLHLNALLDKNSYGDYSLIIRKKIPTITPPNFKSLDLDKAYPSKPIKNFKNNTVFLPEYIGELITGKVVDSKTNKPAKNIKVGLSISGKSPIFKIATTNSLGVIYFDLSYDYEESTAIIQVISDEKEKYRLELDRAPRFNYDNLTFDKINLIPSDSTWIKQKYVHQQIENAFINKKLDSIYPPKLSPELYTPDFIFNLNEYKRFPTIKETVVEVIEYVRIKKKRGQNYFYVNLYDSKKSSNLQPLILIDGNLIQNHQEFYDFDPKEIKTIKLITEKFSYGNTLFAGVIIVETFAGNYRSQQHGEYAKSLSLVQIQPQKNYFKQTYNDSAKFKRTPDYRYQLVWEPNIQLNSDQKEITFYTSDILGTFEVILEGFTGLGKPVYVKKHIEVK